MTPTLPEDARRRELMRGLAVALLTAAFMVALGTEIPVYNDTTGDMLLARDGMATGYFKGGNTCTFQGVRMATLWVLIIAGTFALGLGAVTLHVLTVLLGALSMVAFDRGVRRHFGDDLGSAPVALLLVFVLGAVVYPIATQGNIGLPVLVGSTLALLSVASRGSILSASLCGLSLAFVAELHPVALLGAPIALLTVAMSCRRPTLAVASATACGLAAAMAMSSHAWISNADAFLAVPWCIPLVAVAIAFVLVIAARARPRWLALDLARRSRWLVVGIVVSVLGEMLAASLLAGRSLFGFHYFLFGFPALAILLSLGLRRLGRVSRFGRILAFVIPATLVSLHLGFAAAWRWGMTTGTPMLPNYSLREAEILARHLWASGHSFPDVQRHLRGPESLDLLGGISVFARSAEGPHERPASDLRLIAFSTQNRPDGPVPDGCEEIDLGRGRHAWILPIEPWVGIAPSRACFDGLRGANHAADCVDIASASIRYDGRFETLNERFFPVLGPHRDEGRLTWELPIRIAGDDGERHFDLVGLLAPPWRIVRIDGVAFRGTLPARHVVLVRGGGVTGRIVLAAGQTSMSLRRYPPEFLETRPDEGAIRQSLARRPPLGRFAERAGR